MRKKYGKKLLATTIIATLLLTNTAVVQTVSQQWESPYLKQKSPTNHYNYGIVLGGMASYDTLTARTQFSQSGDRLFQALKLFKAGVFDTLIISGGSAKILEKERFESAYLKEFCVDLGFDTNKIISDSLSRNTRENAINTSHLIKNGNRILLITSSYHMPRAIACFTKEGIYADGYGSDAITQYNNLTLEQYIIPDFGNLFIWQKLIHEWLGYSIYWCNNYI